MSFKLINAIDAKKGSAIMIDGEPCIVRSMDISKTGKHGASKVRMEAVGIFDGKKRVPVLPGHERLEVPLIKKLKGQILSVQDNKASVMDLESFETLDMTIDEDIKNEVQPDAQVEYWEIDGRKIIKRKN